jgi:hypothetical protein
LSTKQVSLLLISNLLFALARPLNITLLIAKKRVLFYVFYYTLMTLDWLSLLILIFILNEVAKIQIDYQNVCTMIKNREASVHEELSKKSFTTGEIANLSSMNSINDFTEFVDEDELIVPENAHASQLLARSDSYLSGRDTEISLYRSLMVSSGNTLKQF